MTLSVTVDLLVTRPDIDAVSYPFTGTSARQILTIRTAIRTLPWPWPLAICDSDDDPRRVTLGLLSWKRNLMTC